MFEFNRDENIVDREQKIEGFWRENKVFEKSLKKNRDKKLFSFYDGPPFATGLPHYGHLLAGTIKDVIPRYKTMKGFYVPRRFGWDCHGLPIENEIEKAQELSGSVSIEEFGIDRFNEECRKIVLRYTEEWKKTVERMGRWVDFEKTYRTMDASFMESVWWVFKNLFEKGLIYEGFKVMPFSAKLGTPLSNFEANLNYREVNDPSLTVMFFLQEDPTTAFLAWTTTPWTLPSNLALAVGKDLDYVKVFSKEHNMHFILAEARLSKYFKEKTDFEIKKRFKGKDLENTRYMPLFNYFADREKSFVVLCDDFVSLEEGTGIVHTAPAFGEIDFFICKQAGIELVCPVDNNGRFTKEVPEYENMLVKDADKPIIRRLKEEKKVFAHETIRHRYPFCWRSDTPLIYKAVHTWFVAVEKIKGELIQANEQIQWVPHHVKVGRFGKWLENARDWAISRNRYWGTPMPVWKNKDGEIKVFGSVKELAEKTNKKIEDLHRHHIDKLHFKEKGKIYRRIPEVFDCWFESGSMPYAQNHYPFENKKSTQEAFPANFVAEGLDQTRGWFYTLNVLSVALFKKPAFENVIVNGIILAEDGTKMSKRLKNYPEPLEVVNRYGADAIRLYLLNSPAVKAEDLRFSSRGVELVLRQILIPFYNAFVFLSTYAKIYQWKPQKKMQKPSTQIDLWILSKMQNLIQSVDNAMEKYELSQAIDPIVQFIDQLTNWFIRRSRTRFWSDEQSQDRKEAFETLYLVLIDLCKLAAPFVPFISESIYQELKTDEMEDSVHLCSFPKYDKAARDTALEKQMDYIQRAVSMGHALRKEYKIKVRQPLSKAHIAASDKSVLQALKKQSSLISDELNVKEIHFYEDESKFVKKIAKPNFRNLGKKVGPLMPKVKEYIQNFEQHQIQHFEKNKMLKITIQNQDITLTEEDLFIEKIIAEGLAAASDQEIAILFDTKISESLFLEGLARELINKVNILRKEEKLQVTDRIEIKIDSTPKVRNCIQEHGKYISGEILAVNIDFGKNQGNAIDLNGEEAVIKISKVEQ